MTLLCCNIFILFYYLGNFNVEDQCQGSNIPRLLDSVKLDIILQTKIFNILF